MMANYRGLYLYSVIHSKEYKSQETKMKLSLSYFLYKERTQSKILSFEDISTCAKDEQ